MPTPIYKAVTDYLEKEVHYGGYEIARKQSQELNQIYKTIANFINADSAEIAILENATAAWNMAFFSIDFQQGDRILTSVSEYASNFIAYLKLQKEVDVQIEVIPNDKFGQTSSEALKNTIDNHVKLISITHMPTNSGLINPIEEIGAIARKHECLYLVDACQSVGHFPVDVQQIGCDMLSATGRKYLRGPRGTGFLYVSKEILPELTPPFLDLHAAEWISQNKYKMRDDVRRFENWEANYAGITGLNKAVEYASKIGIKNIWKRIVKLSEELRWQLEELPAIKVQDIGEVKSGIVTFTADNVEPNKIQKKLFEQNINVNTSSKSSTLLDMQKRNLDMVVRASVHYYNTREEITKFVTAVQKIVGKA
jgi:selenocysteine lyase/cysteine desulfurase